MGDTLDAKDLFKPLFDRLQYYETSRYVANAFLFADYEGELPMDYGTIINQIAYQSYLFSSTDILDVALPYSRRVEVIIRNLKYSEGEFIEYTDGSYTSNTNINKERAEFIFNRHMEELLQYKNFLDNLVKTHEQLIGLESPSRTQGEVSSVQKVVINLDGKLPVKAFDGLFKSQLTNVQATLFLLYLKNTGLIPNYNASSLSRLATLFFAKSSQNIRTIISEEYSLDKDIDDLLSLKQALLSIVEFIDRDLSKELQKL